MSVLQKLTEGVQHRDMQAEGQALLNKWEATGLLEGLNQGQQKQGMAVLLENQAKELLREASSMAAGDVEGFAAVAFPIVRRVFGGLIANDLISVQPMSLPSGLIFFLDFTHNSSRAGFGADGSLYGGGVVGREIVDGVKDISQTGFYGLSSGYANATGSVNDIANTEHAATHIVDPELQSSLDYDPDLKGALILRQAFSALTSTELSECDPGAHTAIRCTYKVGKAENTDLSGDADFGFAGLSDERFITDTNGEIVIFGTSDANSTISKDALFAAAVADGDIVALRLRQVRRLTKLTTSTSAEGLKVVTDVPSVVWQVVSLKDLGPGLPANRDALVAREAAPDQSATLNAAVAAEVKVMMDAQHWALQFPVRDDVDASGNAIGALGFGAMPLEEPTPAGGAAGGAKASGADGGTQAIAEIDIKVDSVAVTAQTKKLKAKWSPELGQDLNAYHNLDAEVELTGILSEQIALEIDRELLGELVRGGTAGVRYWSRAPGLFVDSAGSELGATSAAPDFTGTVSEWYETLIETINDVSAQIHRKTLRGGANFVVCSPEVANILEFTSGFRASVTADQDRGTIGAVKSGSLSKKFDVYVDPYFLRNVILVGRKGSSFLESGYVYAPYVPLQVTPTIFGTEDFVPRKGVMTRYAKKMVRPDMYGLVVVRGLLGEEMPN
ncbi:MAG: hypothetical protein CBD16_05235 [Betaproteobacteria bacterium TMED156]|nr:MAG: hypothetical protein CBD16_05235 [Betaproteobacteria bacterium TMED156]